MKYICKNDKLYGVFVGNLAIQDYFKKNGIHIGCPVNFIPRNYVVLDIESTGLQPDYDEIIEIACVKYRDFKEVDRFCTLVRPDRYIDYSSGYVDDFVSKIIGITHDMLIDAPLFSDVIDDVVRFLDGEIIVGHNVSFDIRFLRNYLFNSDKRKLLINDYLDTLSLSRKLVDSDTHTLECMIFELNLDRISKNKQPIEIDFYRALNDCLATQELYLWLNQIIVDTGLDCNLLFKPKCSSYKFGGSSKLIPDGYSVDKDSIFYGKNVVFTGALKRFIRRDAAQIIVNIGGYWQKNVAKNTDFLVVGDFDFMGDDFVKSNKMKKVDELLAKGHKIEIITESSFYDLICDSGG